MATDIVFFLIKDHVFESNLAMSFYSTPPYCFIAIYCRPSSIKYSCTRSFSASPSSSSTRSTNSVVSPKGSLRWLSWSSRLLSAPNYKTSSMNPTSRRWTAPPRLSSMLSLPVSRCSTNTQRVRSVSFSSSSRSSETSLRTQRRRLRWGWRHWS